MKLIERKHYLDELRQVRGIPDIKVITGLRRSGKSKLMDCFAKEVAKENNTNIIRINMNLKEFGVLKDPEKLDEYIRGHYEVGKENLLFIDEIQM